MTDVKNLVRPWARRCVFLPQKSRKTPNFFSNFRGTTGAAMFSPWIPNFEGKYDGIRRLIISLLSLHLFTLISGDQDPKFAGKGKMVAIQ